MRYLFVPSADDAGPTSDPGPPRVEWRAYEPVEVRAGQRQVTARLRGLAEATVYALRVVSLDAAGHASSPSPVVFARTLPGSSFWRVTPLKVLCALLLGCAALYVRRRREEGRVLRTMEENHLGAAYEDESMVRRD